MAVELAPPWLDLAFMTPMSDLRAARLVSFLAADRPEVVMDLGCGWAELLLRTVDAVPDGRGIGVDHDANAIAHGQTLAASRGLAERVELICGDAAAEGLAPASGAGAVICIGSSQIWRATPDDEDTAEPLDYRSALMALRGLVARGGRVVYGEATWSSPPTPDAVAPLSGRLDEFVALPTLVEIAVSCGFAPMAFGEATLEEWDDFESGYSACFARWLAEHGSDGAEVDVRRRALRQRLAYLAGYRGVMGLGYLQLVAV